jgi:hypothetical protein
MGRPMDLSLAASIATVILCGVRVSGPSAAQWLTNSRVGVAEAKALERVGGSAVAGWRGWQLPQQ